MMPRINHAAAAFAVEVRQRNTTDCSPGPVGILNLRSIGLAAMLGSCLWLQTANAGLPTLNEKNWLGIFGAFKNRHYEITINGQAEIRLSPHNEKGDILSAYLYVPISLGIEEVLPDGRLRLLKILPESLESNDSPTSKLKKAVIRGKVAGGAAFEANIEESRGAIAIGGRVTDPGTATSNPLRFTVVTTLPYYSGGIEKDTPAKRKAYEDTVKDDYLETKWNDGKRHKRMFVTTVDASSPEINGPGITAAEIGIALFQGRKLLLSAATNSSMRFANANPAPTSSGTHVRPLYEGIAITWTADQKKDPKGLARLTLQIK